MNFFKSILLIFFVKSCAGIDWCKYNCGPNKNTACLRNGQCTPTVANCQDVSSKLDKASILSKHNELRSKFALGKEPKKNLIKVANMMALQWDDDLAFVALCALTECAGMKHDQCRVTPKFPEHVGQNLYMRGSSQPCDAELGPKSTQSWYDEVQQATLGELMEYETNFVFRPQIGHFTQVVWPTTTHIGCAMTEQKKADNSIECVIACNYGPGGNIQSAHFYIPGKPCSKCPKGTPCGSAYRGLCGNGGVKLNVLSVVYHTFFILCTIVVSWCLR